MSLATKTKFIMSLIIRKCFVEYPSWVISGVATVAEGRLAARVKVRDITAAYGLSVTPLIIFLHLTPVVDAAFTVNARSCVHSARVSDKDGLGFGDSDVYVTTYQRSTAGSGDWDYIQGCLTSTIESNNPNWGSDGDCCDFQIFSSGELQYRAWDEKI